MGHEWVIRRRTDARGHRGAWVTPTLHCNGGTGQATSILHPRKPSPLRGVSGTYEAVRLLV